MQPGAVVHGSVCMCAFMTNNTFSNLENWFTCSTATSRTEGMRTQSRSTVVAGLGILSINLVGKRKRKRKRKEKNQDKVRERIRIK